MQTFALDQERLEGLGKPFPDEIENDGWIAYHGKSFRAGYRSSGSVVAA